MLTKGAIGNLVNRYKAVLTKCNLMNTFGSLAVASMLVLGAAGAAEATVVEVGAGQNHTETSSVTIKGIKADSGVKGSACSVTFGSSANPTNVTIENKNSSSEVKGIEARSASTVTINGALDIDVSSTSSGIHHGIYANYNIDEGHLGASPLISVSGKTTITMTEGQGNKRGVYGYDSRLAFNGLDIEVAAGDNAYARGLSI